MRDDARSAGRLTHDAGAWWGLLLLMVSNVLMSLDRTIPQMVAEPVKHEFGLSDGELGTFIGVAFGLSYGVSGLLIGPLIDRCSRKNFLASIIAIWSGMTFLTGTAGNYLLLLMTRAGLGAAEAGGNPAALSIIGDAFPPERRSSAIGIYKIGVPLGMLMASVLVGWVASAHGWRAAFFVAGIPGFIVAALIWSSIKEPQRGGVDAASGEYQAASYRQVLAFVLGDRRIAPFALALLLSVFASASLQAFGASFLQRNHGLTLEEVGLYFGIGSALAAISPIVIGLLADRVVRAGYHRIFWFMAGLNLAVTIAAAGVIVSGNVILVIGFFLLWQFLILGLTTPAMAALVTLTPIGMRGTAIALISVGNMCVGFGTGPFVVGHLSDLIGGTDSLRYALMVVMGLSYMVASGLFMLSAHNSK